MKPNRRLVLIDTSAWIEFFRSQGSVEMRGRVTSLVKEGEAAWCEMIRLELWNGARGSREIKELEKMDVSATLLTITSEIWRLADSLASKARLAGKTFPASDLLIAACARFHEAEIVHKDRHFDQIRAL